jgi:hypothetical protein
MFKKIAMVAYGILATLYLLFLLLPLTQQLVNNGGDLVYLVPFCWLTIPLIGFGGWYFFLKPKKVKNDRS